MADKTEKKRSFKDLDDAEKYRFLKEAAITASRFAIGATVLIGTGIVMYHAGKYDCLEYLYNQFPECADTIKQVDPAFFTLGKKLA